VKLISTELHYKIGNASTIISTMGTPIASGVPVEQVIAIRTKRLASSAVGPAASNALIDRYNLNPYIAIAIIGSRTKNYRFIQMGQSVCWSI